MSPSADAISRKTPVNMELFSTSIVKLMDEIAKVAEAKLGEVVRELVGSDSVVVNGVVIAKSLPQDPGNTEHVLLGVASEFNPQQWQGMPDKCVFEGPYWVNQSLFHFMRVPGPAQMQDALRCAASVFGELKTRVEAA